jgi:hypothetical protein
LFHSRVVWVVPIHPHKRVYNFSRSASLAAAQARSGIEHPASGAASLCSYTQIMALNGILKNPFSGTLPQLYLFYR